MNLNLLREGKVSTGAGHSAFIHQTEWGGGEHIINNSKV